jgi:hypothetical protein
VSRWPAPQQFARIRLLYQVLGAGGRGFPNQRISADWSAPEPRRVSAAAQVSRQSSEQRRLYTTRLRDARGGLEALQQMAKGQTAVKLPGEDLPGERTTIRSFAPKKSAP